MYAISWGLKLFRRIVQGLLQGSTLSLVTLCQVWLLNYFIIIYCHRWLSPVKAVIATKTLINIHNVNVMAFARARSLKHDDIPACWLTLQTVLWLCHGVTPLTEVVLDVRPAYELGLAVLVWFQLHEGLWDWNNRSDRLIVLICADRLGDVLVQVIAHFEDCLQVLHLIWLE